MALMDLVWMALLTVIGAVGVVALVALAASFGWALSLIVRML